MMTGFLADRRQLPFLIAAAAAMLVLGIGMLLA
jgi:hypothetical protein